MKGCTYLLKRDGKLYPTDLYPDMIEDPLAVWLYAFDPNAVESPSDKTGKWMLFIPPIHIEECWDKVVTGVQTGNLSSAKTLPKTRLKDVYATMIYTDNYEDKLDVARVLQYLIKVGLKGNREIYYKTDNQTLSGIYRGNEKKPWIYSSADFE